MTQADEAEAASSKFKELSASYKRALDDRARATASSHAESAGWLESNEAGRAVEARMKAMVAAGLLTPGRRTQVLDLSRASP